MSTHESPSALPPESTEAAPAAVTKAPAVAKTAAAASRQGQAGLMVLWVVVLALAAALAWVWQDGKKRGAEWQANTAQRLGALEKTASGQAAREGQYENRLQLVQEKMAALELHVNELQTSRQALEKLYRQLLPLRDEVTMREVEYRIRFAAQQLAMGGNVSTALAALQDADAELTALNRADLATVKVTLAHVIEALQRAPAFDMRGFLTRFDQALNVVAQMMPRDIPTMMPETKITVDETASLWQRWWAETKETVLSMVRLRTGEDSGSRPHVADTALDRQELRLRLLSLRLMVLSRQPAVVTEAAMVRDWLGQHFSESDPAVQTLQSLLGELASSPVAVPLPDVSPVLDALRLWRATQTVAGTDNSADNGTYNGAGGL